MDRTDIDVHIGGILHAIHTAALYPHDSVGRRKHFVIMSSGDHRDSGLFYQFREQLNNFFARLLVEVRRRLVCKYDGRVVCERSGDRHTLLLSAGHQEMSLEA